MFSDKKKLQGTGKKKTRFEGKFDNVSSNYMPSQHDREDDDVEPEPRKIEQEIARLSQAPSASYYGLSESKTFDAANLQSTAKKLDKAVDNTSSIYADAKSACSGSYRNASSMLSDKRT